MPFSISRMVVIVVGVIGMIAGLFIGIIQIVAMFSAAASPYYYNSYSNTLSGVAQESAVQITNIWLAVASVLGGLLLLMPVRMGRLLRAAGYTTPDAEVRPKAYRAGGLYMLIGGVVATISDIIFAGNIAILPIAVIILGVIGLLAGFAKSR